MPQPPRRIASLLASSTEILYGLGLGDRVVAVSHECDSPPEVKDKPRVTFANVDDSASSRQIDDQVKQAVQESRALYRIDVDRLAELQPELIVTQSQCDVCAVSYDDVLETVRTRAELDDTRVVDLNPMSLDDVFTDIRRVGEAAGTADRAESYLAELRSRVDAVRQRVADVPGDQRPRVVVIEWIDPLMLAANWMPQLIELAGGRNELTADGRHSVYHDWQEVLDCDPDVLVVAPCGFDLPRTLAESETLESWPGWRDLAAVQNHRAYAVDGNAYFNRSGPRLVDTLELLAHLFYPQRLPLPEHLRSQQVYEPLT